jgi:hypothetical protein
MLQILLLLFFMIGVLNLVKNSLFYIRYGEKSEHFFSSIIILRRRININIVTCRPLAGQRLGKDVSAAANTQATSVAVQRAVNTIEEEVFCMWLAYIHPGQRMCFLWNRLENI